jgi:N-acetylmuramic acid 6-phosphate etherase
MPDSPEAFLAIADQFQLGKLPTEQPHPMTRKLALLARTAIGEAIEAFAAVDREALQEVIYKEDRIEALIRDLRSTIDAGGRLFLCGCGATGRLALTLEALHRTEFSSHPEIADQVISFMAGGDAALVRSIEAFEDFPDYGARQLLELGFGEKDRLIAITEGGETPFVIGAAEKAAEISHEKPWFLYCNPDEILASVAERSKRILENKCIEKFNLTVGPMALTGSTRLQATSVQLMATGIALRAVFTSESCQGQLEAMLQAYQSVDFQSLAPFIEAEARTYAEGQFVRYETDTYGLTVLTDTTERSPTFSLVPFENRLSPQDPPALAYLHLPEEPTPHAAWKALLGREPRTLEWEELGGIASHDRLMGFDISEAANSWRTHNCAPAEEKPFTIYGPGPILAFSGMQWNLQLEGYSSLVQNLLLKLALNLHSTLVAARMERFEGNLMTYVRPSNAKLIDRAARYVLHLADARYLADPTYEQVVETLFEIRSQIHSGKLPPDSPVVLLALEALARES